MTRSHPLTRCSVLSAALGEPPSATAPVARRWLAIEQAGPWGRDALWQSHLNSAAAEEVGRRAAAAGVSVVMIRRAGAHPDLRRPVPRHVYFADTTPGSIRLTRTVVDDATDLLDIDLTGVPGEDVSGPLILVCTNARRDRCCAIAGRPLARALAESHSPVWESSHLGGHRFAPTMLLLPYGVAYGRQTVDSAAQAIALASSGLITLDRYRGRTTWSRPGQAAEIAVREAVGELAHDTLSVRMSAAPGDGPWLADVQHRDGRAWIAKVVREEAGEPRPESCGKDPMPMEHYRAVLLNRTPVSSSA